MSRQVMRLSPTCTQIRPGTSDPYKRRNTGLSKEVSNFRSQFPNLPGFRKNITTAPQSPKVRNHQVMKNVRMKINHTISPHYL